MTQPVILSCKLEPRDCLKEKSWLRTLTKRISYRGLSNVRIRTFVFSTFILYSVGADKTSESGITSEV